MSRIKLKSKKFFIQNIPVLEIYPQDLNNKPAPLLVFYHGWTSDKIDGADFGTSIAKFGFRVVIPDCAYHGERARQELRMWDVHYLFHSIIETASEFSKIIEFYQNQKLIENDYFVVAGVSMGGIIANVLLRRYPGIKAAGILMGSPQLQGFAEWIVYEGLEDLFRASEEYYSDIAMPDERLALGIINRETDLVLEIIPRLANWDLSECPETIAGRPVLYWHAIPDPIMPYHFTSEFYNSIQGMPEAKYVYLKSDSEGTHMVPLIETRRLGQFLWNCYKLDTSGEANFSKNEILTITNQQIQAYSRG